MEFDDFISAAWNDHVEDAAAVADRLAAGLEMLDDPSRIPGYCAIVTHVFGEHLGRWQDGIDLLQRIDAADDGAVRRSIAVLKLCQGDADLSGFSDSDCIRIQAVATSAFCGQGEIASAASSFAGALALGEAGLAADDPANRALAVSGNNIAASLEEKATLTDDERDLMLTAARAARRYWEIAGDWTHVERAEYRLAKSHLKAGDAGSALEHATACLAICADNDAPALELFFGNEVLCLAQRQLGNDEVAEAALKAMQMQFDALPGDQKPWCEPTLNTLEGAFGAGA